MNRAYLRPPFPLFQVLAGLLYPLVIWSAVDVCVSRMPDLQRLYFGDYLKASVLPEIPSLSFSVGPMKPKPPHTEVLICYVAEGRNFPVTGTLDYNLHPRPVVVPMSRARYATWLQRNIYDGKPPIALLFWPAMVGVLLGSIVYGLAWRLDQDRHLKFRSSGRQLRGPEMVTSRQFNRRVKGDGLGIRLQVRRWLPGPREIRIRRELESQHVMMIGDTGSGKTQSILSITDEAEACEDTCIVYDPHREFIRRYYNPGRGDVILNPTDTRCAHWDPSAEIDYSDKNSAEATALAQAASIYPGNPRRKDWFFTDCCRRIWQHCMVFYHPDAGEMAELMTHADPLIDSISKGTDLEEMLKKNADGQRAGIIGTLTAPILALRQVPVDDGRPVWSARDWAKTRRGWIFITSTQDTREALRPLQSLWLDSLILRLLSMGEQTGLPRVRMILDELATLQELPSLVSALSEGRKAGLTIVTGFQGRSGIKAVYGEEAEGIFSAPYTKVILRTGEPEAAKWASQMIGDREMERVREHRGAKGERTYTTEQRTEPVVMPSQLAGLQPRVGYLRYGNEVVKLKIAIAPAREAVAEGYVQSVGATVPTLPMPNLDEIRAKEEAERHKQAAKAAAYVYDPMANKAKRAKRGPGGGQEGLWTSQS